MKRNKGFTLIEILVVIATFTLLTGIFLSTFNPSKERARNADRASDIRQYLLAFEMFYIQEGEYPDPGDTEVYCLGNYQDDNCWLNGISVNESFILNNILADWIPSLPVNEDFVCSYQEDCYQGYIYQCTDRQDGLCQDFAISWFMEGEGQSCAGGQGIGEPGDSQNCTYCQYTAIDLEFGSLWDSNGESLPRVTDLWARKGAGRLSHTIWLWWTHIDADSYNVYRRIEGEEYTLIGNVSICLPTFCLYFDGDDLIPGVTYYYVVTGIFNGDESEYSNEASATPEIWSR